MAAHINRIIYIAPTQNFPLPMAETPPTWSQTHCRTKIHPLNFDQALTSDFRLFLVPFKSHLLPGKDSTPEPITGIATRPLCHHTYLPTTAKYILHPDLTLLLRHALWYHTLVPNHLYKPPTNTHHHTAC